MNQISLRGSERQSLGPCGPAKWQPLQRAVLLEESWPAEEAEDGREEGEKRKEAPGDSETKRVRPGTWENRVTNT
ncbi:hypothetical protein NQZ68_033364 [Dissostichus eleginoides]|nr:hypothetical protein NQZ68_033364 [Dissostichus eleginoides]